MNTCLQPNRPYLYHLIPWVPFAILTLAAMTGCAIKPDRQLPLVSDQASMGVYKTVYMSMEYRYTYTPADQSGAGNIDFEGHLNIKYSLERLVVRLRFLDNNGKFLHTEILYDASRYTKGNRNISEQFSVVPGTVAFAITSTSKERVYNKK